MPLAPVLIAIVVALSGTALLLCAARCRWAARVRNVEQQAATLSEQSDLLDLARDAILVWNLASGEIRFWNRGAEELYGWSKAEVLGRTPQAVLQTHFPVPLSDINAQLVSARHWEGELVHTRRDGSRVVVSSRWALQVDDEGQPRAVLAINSDITSRKQAEAALEHQALHDALTGLPNRTLFLQRLEQAAASADRRHQLLAVLFLDLDNFKIINDSLGHQAGDQLLVEVGQRLQACLRTSDIVARMGGDEFTVLLEEIDGEAHANLVAERIGEALRQPILIGEREVFVSASIGVALTEPSRTDPESLLRDADIAMYRSKASGKARHSMFDSGMKQVAMERLELETDLRHALALGQFRVHYQPIISLVDGGFAEVEALVRWERPGHGLVPPASFIPVAEETGIIVPIGLWVLQQACRQARSWSARFPSDPPLVMSVNLSARQFQDPHLVRDIERAIESAELDPRSLKLEITETAAMHDIESSVATLHALKALGIQLAIDDFGTGYSSLGYLKRFPVDTLKIDRSFVERIGLDFQDAAIVQSVVALAKTLHLSVVGEGIESQGQAAQLRALGCDRGQGFLFARPQTAEAITVLFAERANLGQSQVA